MAALCSDALLRDPKRSREFSGAVGTGWLAMELAVSAQTLSAFQQTWARGGTPADREPQAQFQLHLSSCVTLAAILAGRPFFLQSEGKFMLVCLNSFQPRAPPCDKRTHAFMK